MENCAWGNQRRRYHARPDSPRRDSTFSAIGRYTPVVVKQRRPGLRAITRIPCMSLFDIGVSRLNAAQWGLTTTGQNISNQATPGYSVEAPVYKETSGQYTGSGYLPQGVSTTTVQRQYSQYLTTQLNDAQSQAGSLSSYYSLIAQLNNLVGSPTSGISSQITAFFTGLQNVGNNASDLAVRQSAVNSAQSLSDQINADGDQYDQLRSSVNTQLTDTVAQVNTYTAQIAQLNQQI